MRMGMSMHACMQQLCTVCDQPITGPDADQEAAARAIFGAKGGTFNVCCKCGQSVGKESQDAEYRRRWKAHRSKQ